MPSARSYAIIGLLSLQTLIICLSSTINQYVYAYYLQTYPNSSNGTSNDTTTTTYDSSYIVKVINDDDNKCSQSDIPSNKDAQAWAQQHSADLFFWINLISSGPVIIMTYILGLYTVKLGKRLVLLLPMIGTAIQIVIWLLIIYFHLPEYWWFISAFIVGLSGSTGVLGLTLNLIITENTIESERSSFFVRLGAIQTAISAIATFGIGYYIIWRGFTDLYWTALSLEIVSMIIVIKFFKFVDINTNHDEQASLLSSTDDELNEHSSTTCKHFFQICTVFYSNRRSKKKTISLFLTLFANIFFTLATVALAPLLWFFLNAPFCWTSKDVGNYSALSAICSAILSVVGMQVLTYLGARDAIICSISLIFFCASCLWTAFARYSWQLYVGLFISAFSGYQGTLTMSMISKWLEIYERNYAFTFITEMNTIITTFGNSFFNWVYARTVVNYRNLTLLIAAGLGVIPLILNICLLLITRTITDEELSPLLQTDSESTPSHLQNNVVPYVDDDDDACMVIPSQSLTSSLHTSIIKRSRANSGSDNETEEIINSSNNDLSTL